MPFGPDNKKENNQDFWTKNKANSLAKSDKSRTDGNTGSVFVPEKRPRQELTTTDFTRQAIAEKAKKRDAGNGKNRRRRRRKKAALLPFYFLGNILYLLGFYAECRFVQVGRVLRDAGVYLSQIFSWIFKGIFSKLGGLLKDIWRDITTPFIRIYHGLRNTKQYAAQQRERGEEAVSGRVMRYFGRGVKSYYFLLGNIVKILLPVVSVVILGATVYSVMRMQYVLSVEVNGEFIGYVSNESVIQDAQNNLRMKLRLAENQTMDALDFSPVLKIATSNKVSNTTQIMDGYLRTYGDVVTLGTGIYIEGELVGATQDGDGLRNFLQERLEIGKVGESPDTEIEFVKQVDVSEGEELFFVESVKPVDELEQELSRTVSEERRYTVLKGDTLTEIAHKNGITLEALLARNPEFEGKAEEYKPDVGTELLIERAQPYLQVQTIEKVMVVEPIPYDTEEVEVTDRVKGFRRVTTRGVNGEQEVPYEFTYIDGERVKAEGDYSEESVRIIKEPVTEVVTVGAGAPTYSGVGGNEGYFVFPVPNYTYSSRGFMGAAHRGQDINAPSGTPIYAADGGVVEVAGSHYSYGNYVVIRHANGLKTLYAHCTELFVSAGDVVGQKEQIATVGSTGFSTGPHCHFEVQDSNGGLLNPLDYISLP